MARLLGVFFPYRLVDVYRVFTAKGGGGDDIAFELHRASDGFVFDAQELPHVVAGEGGAFDEFPHGERHVADERSRESHKAAFVLLLAEISRRMGVFVEIQEQFVFESVLANKGGFGIGELGADIERVFRFAHQSGFLVATKEKLHRYLPARFVCVVKARAWGARQGWRAPTPARLTVYQYASVRCIRRDGMKTCPWKARCRREDFSVRREVLQNGKDFPRGELGILRGGRFAVVRSG